MSSTSYNLDFLMEIQGLDVAFTAQGSTNAPVTWSQSLVEAIASVVPMASMDVNPYDGSFGNGGMGILSVEAASYMLDRKDGTICRLGADLAKSATTVTVDSTTGFASSGTIWIDAEAITYSGTTATTFTGCTRGSHGTYDVAHEQIVEPSRQNTIVYSYNPTLHGRKVWLHSFDPQDPTNTKITISVGYIDDVTFSSESGYEFQLISVAQRLEEKSVATGIKAKGRLRYVITSNLQNSGRVMRRGGYTLPRDTKSAELAIELEDYTNPFPYDSTGTAGQLEPVSNGALKLGEEVIKYNTAAWPGMAVVVNNTGTGNYGPYIQAGVLQFWIEVGDTIQFTDSGTGDTIRASVVHIENTDIYHSAQGYAPATGTLFYVVNVMRVGDLERAQAGTKRDDHEAGRDASQVWCGSSDHVVSVLQLLASGNGSGGTYDVLPSWLGAGIPNDEIDFDSFQSIGIYSRIVSLTLTEPSDPKSILADLALLTGARIFVSEAGKVTARRDFAIYPDVISQSSISVDTVVSVPAWEAPVANVYNQWTWKMAGAVTVNHEITESQRLYGKRSLPSPLQDILIDGLSLGMAEAYAVSTLFRYAVPNPNITVELPEEGSLVLQPGQVVSVTFEHLPDQAGSEGFTTQYFEVIAFQPNGTTVNLQLLRIPAQTRVGLVAPAAIVDSQTGNEIVVKDTASSYLSPQYARDNALSSILGSARDGQEDVDWFLDGDSIQLIDESTLGSGTPTTASVVIDTVNYSTKTIFLTTTVPAWVADGDYIRLDDYLTVDANIVVNEQRTPFFSWWSDATPAMPGGDDPYRWGS